MDIKKVFTEIRKNGITLTMIHALSRRYTQLYNKKMARQLNDAINLRLSLPSKIVGIEHVRIGKNFSAGQFLWINAVAVHNDIQYEPVIVVKDNVIINNFVTIAATHYVEIGNNVLMASRIFISDHNHGIYNGDCQSSPHIAPIQRIMTNDSHVIIEDNVWIGENVCILHGTRVGKGSVIGSNSVVSKDIPEFCIAVGNPAKVIKRYDESTKIWVS
jgi:acetyltransferase-like isoleucine patch superfamily enzyme